MAFQPFGHSMNRFVKCHSAERHSHPTVLIAFVTRADLPAEALAVAAPKCCTYILDLYCMELDGFPFEFRCSVCRGLTTGVPPTLIADVQSDMATLCWCGHAFHRTCQRK